MSEFIKFNTREDLDRALAVHVAGQLAADIARRGEALLAVSGGNTPKGVFRELANADIDWARVTVTLVDERWVPPDHADSNERLVRENLLQGAAAAAHLQGLKTAHEDADAGLPEAEAAARSLALPFTVTILGMGGDGHTASWFPQAANLAQLLDPEGSALLGVCDPVTAPHRRITFTLPALLRSRELILHITGEDKRAVLQAAAGAGHPIAAAIAQSVTPLTTWWAP